MAKLIYRHLRPRVRWSASSSRAPSRDRWRKLLLLEPIEQVAANLDDDLVRRAEHALACRLARQRVEERPYPERDVTPALAAGRPVVELPELRSPLGFLRRERDDAGVGEPVEDAGLPLPQPLVDDNLGLAGKALGPTFVTVARAGT